MYFLLEKVDFQPAILVYQRLHAYPIFWQEIHWPSSAIPATCRRESHKIHKILILKGEVEKMWTFESSKFGAKKIGSFAQKMHEDLIKDILTDILGFHRLWLSMKIYAKIDAFEGPGLTSPLEPEAATPRLQPWPQFKSRCLPRNSQMVIYGDIVEDRFYHNFPPCMGSWVNLEDPGPDGEVFTTLFSCWCPPEKMEPRKFGADFQIWNSNHFHKQVTTYVGCHFFLGCIWNSPMKLQFIRV